MYLDITQEEKKLTPNERLVFQHLNQKLDMWSGFVDLLERLEQDKELDKSFQHMSPYDWTEVQRGLHDKYFKVVKYPKETERKVFVGGDFKGYTKNNFLIFINEHEEITICNIIFAVRFSKTSIKKLESVIDYNELTRLNLFELFYSTNGNESDFISKLKEKGVHWKVAQILDPSELMTKYPEVSA